MVEIKRLLNDYIAVRVDDIKERTDSGLYIPEQIKTYPPTGTVEQVDASSGNGDIAVGDRVQFKVYASIDLEEGLVAIPYGGIIAIIK